MRERTGTKAIVRRSPSSHWPLLPVGKPGGRSWGQAGLTVPVLALAWSLIAFSLTPHVLVILLSPRSLCFLAWNLCLIPVDFRLFSLGQRESYFTVFPGVNF